MGLYTLSPSRIAPSFENGLVRPPENLDCVGAHCPVAERDGSCGTSIHHWYIRRPKFINRGGTYAELFDDPHAQRRMAQCAHDEEHRNYDTADFPRLSIVKRFLHESGTLSGLGVVVDRLADNVGTLNQTAAIYDAGSGHSKDRLDEMYGLKVENALAKLRQHDRRFQEQMSLVVATVDVMPEAVAIASIDAACIRRESLQVPELLATA